MNIESFRSLLEPVVKLSAGRDLDDNLMNELNHQFGADSGQFKRIRDACHEAIAAGWMCNRRAGKIDYGRVLKHDDNAMAGFSVDVVSMTDVVGPRHEHPNGEIDMIMPVDQAARFDDHAAGWLVYGPGTVHSPTVTGGRALVLYLLPGGAIEFSV